jgi:hypothetical protein
MQGNFLSAYTVPRRYSFNHSVAETVASDVEHFHGCVGLDFLHDLDHSLVANFILVDVQLPEFVESLYSIGECQSPVISNVVGVERKYYKFLDSLQLPCKSNAS